MNNHIATAEQFSLMPSWLRRKVCLYRDIKNMVNTAPT